MYKQYYNKLIYKNITGYLAVTDINKKVITINRQVKLNKIEKYIVIAHECAHIILKSLSHSLLWEKIFFKLLQDIKKKYKKEFNTIYINLINKYRYNKHGVYCEI